MNWSGPAGAEIGKEVEEAFQNASGRREIYVVDSPEASERFLSWFPHLRGPPQTPPHPPSEQ